MQASLVSARPQAVEVPHTPQSSVQDSIDLEGVQHCGDEDDVTTPGSGQSPASGGKKRVTWNTADLSQRCNAAAALSRSFGHGLLRVYYGYWLGGVQLLRLSKRNQSLQRMLGDGSSFVDSKVKTLTEENRRKAEKIKDLTKKLEAAKKRITRSASESLTRMSSVYTTAEMSAVEVKHAAELKAKDDVIASLQAKTASLTAQLDERGGEVTALSADLTKANDAILTGADEFYTVSSSLTTAHRSLRAVKRAFSPEKLEQALTPPHPRPAHASPTPSVFHSHPSLDAPARAPATAAYPPPSHASPARQVQTPVRGPEPSPSLPSADPNLTVEHQLKQLIKQRRRSGLTTPAQAYASQQSQQSQPAELPVNAASKDSMLSSLGPREAREALGLVLHQLQLQKTLAEHRNAGEPERAHLDLVQSSLRDLISGSQNSQVPQAHVSKASCHSW